MTKTNIKTPILQRTVLVLAMSAISFPSYSLGSGDDDYTFADEGQVIIDNRDRSQGNEPPRDCRRPNFLREYDNENTTLHS